MQFQALSNRVRSLLRSQQGKNALVFFVFVLISAFLWLVFSASEENQFDLRVPLKISHVPDSVTLISSEHDALNVSITVRGTQLLRHAFGYTPSMDIDFRAYRSQNGIHLTNADLKAIARSTFGASQVNFVYPDSLTIAYTTHPGYKMPVEVDYKVTPGPTSVLVGRPVLSTDSVKVFIPTNKRLPQKFDAVTTEPIRISNLDKTVRQKVKLLAPLGSRVIPDSIDVTFEAEPLIIKTRQVVIEPVNVPPHIRLITFPSKIEVVYMVPMSLYSKSDPHFRVLADYKGINPNSKMMKLRLTDVSHLLRNVYLSTDSAEYIIEQKR